MPQTSLNGVDRSVFVSYPESVSGRSAELLNKIPETEQLELAFDIWEKFAGKRIAIELTQTQQAELGRRLKSHQANPMLGRSWEELKRDLGE